MIDGLLRGDTDGSVEGPERRVHARMIVPASIKSRSPGEAKSPKSAQRRRLKISSPSVKKGLSKAGHLFSPGKRTNHKEGGGAYFGAEEDAFLTDLSPQTLNPTPQPLKPKHKP